MPKSAKPTVRYDKYTTITQKCRKITPGKDYREKCGLMRTGDLAGLLNDRDANGQPDLTRFKKFIDTFTDVELATGDAVSPSQMVRLFQNLGPAALSMDEQGLGTTMLMALSLGQLKTGTGINQMF